MTHRYHWHALTPREIGAIQRELRREPVYKILTRWHQLPSGQTRRVVMHVTREGTKRCLCDMHATGTPGPSNLTNADARNYIVAHTDSVWVPCGRCWRRIGAREYQD